MYIKTVMLTVILPKQMDILYLSPNGSSSWIVLSVYLSLSPPISLYLPLFVTPSLNSPPLSQPPLSFPPSLFLSKSLFLTCFPTTHLHSFLIISCIPLPPSISPPLFLSPFLSPLFVSPCLILYISSRLSMCLHLALLYLSCILSLLLPPPLPPSMYSSHSTTLLLSPSLSHVG